MTDQTPNTIRALVCPKCHNWTPERTSTNNGFCRSCDYIFGSDARVTLTQGELRALAEGQQTSPAAGRESCQRWDATRHGPCGICAACRAVAPTPPKLAVAARALVEALKARHYGRMPDDVQTAFDALQDALARTTPAPTGAPPIDHAAARSAAAFARVFAARQSHTEAVADCAHCTLAFLATWVLDLLGPEPVRPIPPGPADPPRRVTVQEPTPHPATPAPTGAPTAQIAAATRRSPVFARFLDADFWDAAHVDIVWRINGRDVREQGDWLKDVWYALRRK